MTNFYRIKSLAELIDELRALPEGAQIQGIESGEVHSDRGYYERGAVTPSAPNLISAATLASQLEQSVGKPMHGWKGGEYFVSGQLPVAYAPEGHTGPYIGGFSSESNAYEPVLIEEGWW